MTDQPDLKKARRRKATLSDPAKVDKLPPHSVEAEQGVLGCIMLSTDCLDTCIEKLESSEAFYSLANRQIYETMLALHEERIPIDLIILQQELKDLCLLEGIGGLAYLAELPNATPSAANLEYYLDIVAEKFTLRNAINTCTEVVTRAYEHQGDVETLVGELTRDMLAISQSYKKQSTFYSAKQLVRKTVGWAERALENQGRLTGISTGFADLDLMIDGLQGGNLIVIAARPSLGKSSLCMNIADHVAVNLRHPVVVFSLEMSAESLMNRAVCSRARVNMKRVSRGQMLERDFAKFTSASSQLNSAPLYIDDASGTNILKLQAKARSYHQQYGVKLFIIDYLQLMSAKAESRQCEITAISGGVKAIAKDLNVPVIILSQLNRETEKDKNRKPRMSDLRESGSIEQDADVIGLLYKPKVDDEESQENSEAPVTINLLIAKQRNGPVGEIPLAFFKTFTRFETATTEQTP